MARITRACLLLGIFVETFVATFVEFQPFLDRGDDKGRDKGCDKGCESGSCRERNKLKPELQPGSNRTASPGLGQRRLPLAGGKVGVCELCGAQKLQTSNSKLQESLKLQASNLKEVT
jgi:hypothetical protein